MDSDKLSKTSLVSMERRGFGNKGEKIQLLTNHFGVNLSNSNGHFYHYSVSITYEDGNHVETKGIGRKILQKVQETYKSDLGFKYFAYDGAKTLFTVGPLPKSKLDFSVVLEEMVSVSRRDDAAMKRLKRPNPFKKFNVEIDFAAKIPIQAIANALQGNETNQLQDCVRVLDVILCHKAASIGCLLVRQSFFQNERKFFTDIGEGVDSCKGFHTSFRTTKGGVSLNIDVSSTMIVQPGPVINFLRANQKVKNLLDINWRKAKSTLKNLRVKVIPSNREYKITGISEKICRDQTFLWKRKNENGEVNEVEITVFDYFTKNLKMELEDSKGDLPCINVGKPNRPTYFPVEHCHLVSLQRYTKALSPSQRSNLVTASRQSPEDKLKMLSIAFKNGDYNSDKMLKEAGVSIRSDFTQVEGRVLPTPKLKVGKGADLFPNNGRWNFNQKTLVAPTKITNWVAVNFSARCNPHKIITDLIRCGKMKGLDIDPPLHSVFQEDPRFKDAPGSVRVERMVALVQSKFPRPEDRPLFLLCILAEKKTSNVYGPWKKKTLVQFGIVTQCIAPPPNANDQYLTNVLLKINAKLGGLNSMLDHEMSRSMPSVMRFPTLIIGMDVSHGPPGQSDAPSIAAVVSSREWPLISKYRAFVRTQSPKVEMINNLFNRVSDKDDEGIMREILRDFYSSCKVKPQHIIIFRDGVSESQFNQVLNIELDQMKQACKFLDENLDPKFTVIIAQKRHHTKFFQTKNPNRNVPPGTIIDNKICHPRNNDFYLCAHAGIMGTTRPTHYHVLYDEIGLSADDLQELVHSLSYVYQKSTNAISVVAPICYAHLAAAQMESVMKSEDTYEMTSSSHSGNTTDELVPPMPKLHKDVATSMFFC